MGKGKGFIHEFEKFISRGNVMDMAVGVIIGGAFSSIITSLVDDILSPILGIFGGLNFDELSLNIMGDVTLKYGKFLTAVINFLIMALVIFCLVKAMNALSSKMVPVSYTHLDVYKRQFLNRLLDQLDFFLIGVDAVKRACQ